VIIETGGVFFEIPPLLVVDNNFLDDAGIDEVTKLPLLVVPIVVFVASEDRLLIGVTLF
jgi:hypothetical protein